MPRNYVKKGGGAPVAVPRATDRGIPQKITDAILRVLPIDESELTLDSRLVEDLHADDEDIQELAMEFEGMFKFAPIDEEILEQWEIGTLGDVVKALTRLGVKW